VVLATVVEAVFPAWCAGCGARGGPVCARCAASLAAAPNVGPPAFVDGWVALFSYEGVARELTARLKYRNARPVVPWFADRLAAAAAGRFEAIDAVTWAPTTTAHRRTRGFDHAQLLATAVARRLGRPARPLLARVSQEPQTGRPAAERRRGVAFRAVAASPTRAAPASVLLVDDVATTGATVRAAAAALREAGAQRVYAATVARTPPGRAGGRFAPSAYTPAR
jgi:predicted amidophosphoribosyltransferase